MAIPSEPRQDEKIRSLNDLTEEQRNHIQTLLVTLDTNRVPGQVSPIEPVLDGLPFEMKKYLHDAGMFAKEDLCEFLESLLDRPYMLNISIRLIEACLKENYLTADEQLEAEAILPKNIEAYQSVFSEWKNETGGISTWRLIFAKAPKPITDYLELLINDKNAVEGQNAIGHFTETYLPNEHLGQISIFSGHYRSWLCAQKTDEVAKNATAAVKEVTEFITEEDAQDLQSAFLSWNNGGERNSYRKSESLVYIFLPLDKKFKTPEALKAIEASLRDTQYAERQANISPFIEALAQWIQTAEVNLPQPIERLNDLNEAEQTQLSVALKAAAPFKNNAIEDFIKAIPFRLLFEIKRNIGAEYFNYTRTFYNLWQDRDIGEGILGLDTKQLEVFIRSLMSVISQTSPDQLPGPFTENIQHSKLDAIENMDDANRAQFGVALAYWHDNHLEQASETVAAAVLNHIPAELKNYIQVHDKKPMVSEIWCYCTMHFPQSDNDRIFANLVVDLLHRTVLENLKELPEKDHRKLEAAFSHWVKCLDQQGTPKMVSEIVNKLPASLKDYMQTLSRDDAIAELQTYCEDYVSQTGTRGKWFASCVFDWVQADRENPSTSEVDNSETDTKTPPLSSLDDITTVEHSKLEDAFNLWKQGYNKNEKYDKSLIPAILRELPDRLKAYLLDSANSDPANDLRYYCDHYISSIERYAFRFATCIGDWLKREEEKIKYAAGTQDVEIRPAPTEAFRSLLIDQQGYDFLSTTDFFDLVPIELKVAAAQIITKKDAQQALDSLDSLFRNIQISKLNRPLAEVVIQEVDYDLDDYLDAKSSLRNQTTDYRTPNEALQTFSELDPTESNTLAVMCLNMLGDPENGSDFSKKAPERLMVFIQDKIQHPKAGWPLLSNLQELLRTHGLDLSNSKNLAQLIIDQAGKNIPTEKNAKPGSQVSAAPAKKEPISPAAEQEILRKSVHQSFVDLCKHAGVSKDHPLLKFQNFKEGKTFTKIGFMDIKTNYRVAAIDWGSQRITIVQKNSTRNTGSIPFKDAISQYLT